MTGVLFVHHWGGIGGAGVSLANVIRGLPRDRFRPAVVCPPGDVVGLFEQAGARVHITPRTIHCFPHTSGGSRCIVHPAFLHAALNLWRDRSFWERYFRACGADIIVFNSITTAPMAIAAKRAGKRVVCCVRETLVRGTMGVRTAWLNRLLSSEADAVCFLSDYDRQMSRCRAPIVEVIPNWVDFRRFDRSISQKESRARLGLPVESRIVLFLGGISRLKGTLPLIQAIGRLAGVNNLLLLICGYTRPPLPATQSPLYRFGRAIRAIVTPDYTKAVHEAIATAHLQERIRFFGAMEHVVEFFAAADVVAFPATKMHQARPILEAGAMAKPVVATDFECYREYIRDGVNGLTAAPGDADALATALRRVLETPDFAKRLGEENYSLARARHDASVNAPRYVQLLERVVELPLEHCSRPAARGEAIDR